MVTVDGDRKTVSRLYTSVTLGYFLARESVHCFLPDMSF